MLIKLQLLVSFWLLLLSLFAKHAMTSVTLSDRSILILIYNLIPTPSKVLGISVEHGMTVFRRSSEIGLETRASQTSFSLFPARKDAPTIRHCMLLWSAGPRVLTLSSYLSESLLWIPCPSRLSRAFLVLGTRYPSTLASIPWLQTESLTSRYF